MVKFTKMLVAMLAMVAMAVGVASCDKDKDDEKGGGSISYDALFDKMWVVTQEKYESIDEETGKKETATISIAEIEEDGWAIDLGFVLIYEKVKESSRFVYVKEYRYVGHKEYFSTWNYAVIDKTDNMRYGCGDALPDESILIPGIEQIKAEGEDLFTIKEVSNSKFVLRIDEDKYDSCESTYVPQSSWKGKSKEDIISSSKYGI